MIHSTAIIHPGAQLGTGVSVGPHAVIDEHVQLGDGCRVGPSAYLTGHTVIGKNNRFHAGSVIGDAPQDLKYAGQPTRLVIGDRNTFREHTTVNRSATEAGPTVIGNDNLFMATVHVGHNSRVGDHVIMANGAMLGGHALVQDRAFISGSCLVHQFVRVGTLSMMQGGSTASMDVPPFCIVTECNLMSGLNTIGLKRAGMKPEERQELRRTYHALFLRTDRLQVVLDALENTLTSDAAKALTTFVRESKRGVCSHAGSPHKSGPEPE